MSIYNKIRSRKAVVGIMGLGYVGLSNAILIDKKKFKVIGFDINTAKIENLNKNVSYVEDVTENDLINFKRNILSQKNNI